LIPVAILVAIGLVGAIAVATYQFVRWYVVEGKMDRSGWVYFLSGPNTAIKVGYTQRDPTVDRLPEIRTISPVPLRIIFKFRAPDVKAAEAAVHEQLKDHRLHGEWFDRDAALAYIDYLKGSDGQRGTVSPRSGGSSFDDAVLEE
jgi:hypothetical protein